MKEQKENNYECYNSWFRGVLQAMTDKTKKAFNNAIASARMEGFDFTDEQIDILTKLIERVDRGEITWNEAIKYLIKKYRR